MSPLRGFLWKSKWVFYQNAVPPALLDGQRQQIQTSTPNPPQKRHRRFPGIGNIAF